LTRRRAIVLGLSGAAVLASPWWGGLVLKPLALMKLTERFGHPAHARACRLGWMGVVLRDVEIDDVGSIERVAASASTIEVERPALLLTREDVERVMGRHRKDGEASSGSASGGAGRRIVVHEGAVAMQDEALGLRVRIGKLGCDLTGRTGTVVLEDLEAEHKLGASVRAQRLELQLAGGRPRAIAVAGGEVTVWKGFALTGIEGTALPQVALTGGYGGVHETLWRAVGNIDVAERRADVTVEAKKFTLDKVRPILGQESVILDPEKATVSGRLDVSARAGRIGFTGQLLAQGLDIGYRSLGQKAVRDLEVTARLAGSASTRERRLELQEATLEHRGVRATLSGSYDWSGPRPKLAARLRVPAVSCPTLLAALPRPLVPAIADFKLKGTFDLDVYTKIDWNDLESLELGGNVGINGCKVLEAPKEVAAVRLQAPFDHRVEVEPGHDLDFEVGPANPDWTPFGQISPNITNSLMTTEDNGFFKHRGFITREFRSALIQNLERGYFRLGASSITMQMIKNVLLTREKTLSRKLQEMFLTWYLEQNLPKERIFEIYLNVIEFGPGIYGIGRAMRHYFGKPPAQASPREAAFFSSILPNPKRRYAHYCRGALTDKWEQYLNRILRRMFERDRLTEAQFAEATSHPLQFDRKEAMPEKTCLDMVKRMTTTTPVDTEADLRVN